MYSKYTFFTPLRVTYTLKILSEENTLIWQKDNVPTQFILENRFAPFRTKSIILFIGIYIGNFCKQTPSQSSSDLRDIYLRISENPFHPFSSRRSRISKTHSLMGDYVIKVIYSEFHISKSRDLGWGLMIQSESQNNSIYVYIIRGVPVSVLTIKNS